jgi:hypothetical protein
MANFFSWQILMCNSFSFRFSCKALSTCLSNGWNSHFITGFQWRSGVVWSTGEGKGELESSCYFLKIVGKQVKATRLILERFYFDLGRMLGQHDNKIYRTGNNFECQANKFSPGTWQSRSDTWESRPCSTQGLTHQVTRRKWLI